MAMRSFARPDGTKIMIDVGAIESHAPVSSDRILHWAGCVHWSTSSLAAAIRRTRNGPSGHRDHQSLRLELHRSSISWARSRHHIWEETMARHPLKGSAKTLLPGAQVLGNADPAERLEVSVRLRRKDQAG